MFTLGFHLDRFIKLLPLYQVGELPLPHCAPIIFPIDKPPFFMAKPPFFYGKTIIFHHETTIFLWRFCHVSPQTVPNLRDTPPGPSLAAEWRLTSRRSRHCWGRNLAKRSASRAISPGSDAIFEPFGYSMYPIRFTCVYIYMYMIHDIWYMIHDICIWYMIYTYITVIKPLIWHHIVEREKPLIYSITDFITYCIYIRKYMSYNEG